MVKKIIGSVLVKNEDRFIEQSIRNIVNFCDHIIVSDNWSTDSTYAILQKLADEYSHLELNRIDDTRESMNLLHPYIGGDYWVFGVDGDEVYDPLGLAEFKEKIIAGEFDQWWVIFGNVLNCTFVDECEGVARGYLALPSRSMTKLYNFSVITAWDGPCGHRLSGGTPCFSEGYDASLRYDIYKSSSWEEAQFRCLHTCFTNRSSLDTITEDDQVVARLNITENQNQSKVQLLRRLVARLLRKPPSSNWKIEKYARGPLVEKEVSHFFNKIDG